MSEYDEDDKPTVVLDIKALKKQKIKDEEDLANLATELEFAISPEAPAASTSPAPSFKVILFDFQSDFFRSSLSQLPPGYDYKVATSLSELNQFLKSKDFQIVVFNYDSSAKAVNQLCTQIKSKVPTTKTLIMAKAISPQKAKLHAQTPAGAMAITNSRWRLRK